MTLAVIYKVFGGFHMLMGVMMGLTLPGTIPDGEGWGYGRPRRHCNYG